VEQVTYCLAPALKMRKEAFGLLFYNTRDTKLTFVKSAALLDDHLLAVEKDAIRLVGDSARENKKLVSIMQELVKRGLFLERPQ